MKRFEDDDFEDHNIWSDSDDDDEKNEEVEEADEMEALEDYQALVRQQELDARQYDLIERDTNHKILKQAVRMCEKSVWWRFYSTFTKLKVIKKVYAELNALTLPAAK
jgi:hypothetical protein